MKPFRRFLLPLFFALAIFVVSFQAFAFAFALPAILPGVAAFAVRVGGLLQSATVPVGGLSIGAGIAGFYHRLTSGETIWVSPFSTTDEPNPDIPTIPPSSSAGYPVSLAGQSYPYVSAPTSIPWGGGCNGPCPITDKTKEFHSRILSLLATMGYYPAPTTLGSFSWYSGSNSSCPDVSPASSCVSFGIALAGPNTHPSFAVTTGVKPSSVGYVLTQGTSGSNPAYGSLFIPISNIVSAVECDSSAVYDYSLHSCVVPAGSSEAMADGICRISWSPVNGCPIKSPFDPDCITSSAQVSLSCGTSTTPPSVKIRDLAASDQKETEVQRPAVPTQGTPGSLTVKERAADPANNTTTERRTDASAPPTAGSPPVIQGAGQNVLPGVGTNVGTTPLEQVAISNWPSSLNVNCTNCTPSAPITFPETMKIDGEVPEGTELPETPELEVSGFLDPIKDRFSSLTGLQFPAHTAKCPVLAIKFNVGSQVVDQSSTFMCDLLEEQRAAIQMLMALAFTGLAISIVLRS